MSKRGQITIFVIIAIVIVGVVLAYFFVLGGLAERNFFKTRVAEVHFFVSTCIETTGKDAVYDIAKRGGYLSPPELSTSQGLPYYYLEGNKHMPSKEKVQEEISRYVEENLRSCTKDFVDFTDVSIASDDEINANTKIIENEVIFDVELPTTIRIGNDTSRIVSFENIRIPSTLNNVYDAVYDVIQDQLTHDNICITCISNITERDDLTADLINTEEGVIFTFTNNNKINDFPIEWNFANKY